MRRSQRKIHRVLWPVLAAVIAVLLTLALIWRAPAATWIDPATAETIR